MTVPIEIATFNKGRAERVRLALDEYRGQHLVDFRILAQLSESSGTWCPTKKGVSLAVRHLPELARAFAVAADRARALGLIGGDA